MTRQNNPPVVMAISGVDPTGGAGIQADIEAIAAQGGFCAPVITTLTVQDTRNAWRVDAVDPQLVIEQAEAVLDDLKVAAIKLGLLGNAYIGHAVAELLSRHPDIPVVLDPVLIAGGGAKLAEDPLVPVMLAELVPRASVVTPNIDEALALVPGETDADACARHLVRAGADFVLLKGGHEQGESVINRLHGEDDTPRIWSWPRLPGGFHGSGCTLASALAACLAHGLPMHEAAERAQVFVQGALAAAYRIGRGLPVPARMHRLTER